jgi:hypothetical protein
MIQNIIDGIIAAIRTEYDKSFKIYTESVEQGLKVHCFSVLCLNGLDEKNAGARHNRTYPFIIRYFPSSEDEPIAECLAIMESLYDLLSIIDVGTSRLRGTGMNGAIVDGVLQFQVTYASFLLAAKTETSMEELEVKTDGNE